MKIICGIWLSFMTFGQAAGLDFPLALKEIHAPPDVKSVIADFDFTNRSNQPVTVSKYEATCSCMSVKIQDGKLIYAPGESGTLRAEFDMNNFTGSVDKVVAVWLDRDPPDKPSLSLTVRVHIPVLVSLTPKTVKWDVDGKGEPQTIHITMNHNRPIRITSVTTSSDAFKQELKTVEDGKIYDLIITPLAIHSPGLGIIRIETDCDIPKHRIQQAFASVRKSKPLESNSRP